jgi:alkylation response protein AidB-like acyl-CoA dehydrogenase
VEFASPADLEAQCYDVQAFLAEHLPRDVIERVHETGTVHDWAFHRALATTPWFAGPWPEEAGGAGLGPLEMASVVETMARAGAPLDGWFVTMNVASTLRTKATAALRAEVLPSVLAGEAIICLGLTEPDAGSDVAAIKTRAVADGDEWVIDGQKMFTTLAHEARWVFLLTRTDPATEQHRGLTVFLVPMESDGVDIQPVHTLGGERTNITFYSGVRVSDRWRVGDVDGGWGVLMTALAYERGGEFGGNALFIGTLARVLELAAEAIGADATAPGAVDPLVAARLGRIAADLDVARLLSTRSAWVAGQRRSPIVEAAMAKLHATESLQRGAADLLDLLGPEGLLRHGDPAAPAHGWIEHAHRHAAVTTIYGGTSEVMRTIVATHGLGLPRPTTGS